MVGNTTSSQTLNELGLGTIELFSKVHRALENDSSRDPSIGTILSTEADRFGLWAISLGLFVPGHGSLDYRVREAENIRDVVKGFLETLNDSLSEAIEYLSLEAGSEDLDKPLDDSAVYLSDSDSEDEWWDESGHDDAADVEAMLDSIKDPIDRLYKLSTWIRNPSTRFASSKVLAHKHIDEETGADLLEAFCNFDFNYIESVFSQYRKSKLLEERGHDELEITEPEEEPRLPEELANEVDSSTTLPELYLVSRLAQANGRRRQQFSYWRRHREKLSLHTTGIEIHSGHKGNKLTPNDLHHHDHKAEDASVGIHPLSVTTATRLNIPQHLPINDAVSVVSVSKYAPSNWSPEDEKLDFPAPPSVPPDQKFFECPYCFTLCPRATFESAAWKAHLIRDLRPYVCTYQDCKTPNQLYDTRRDWLHHENSIHRRVFHCPQHENKQFFSLADYQKHISDGHLSSNENIPMSLIIQSNESTLSIPDRKCPVCLTWIENMEALQKHIALHLERFAIFSLPRGISRNDQEAGSKGANVNWEGSRDEDFDEDSPLSAFTETSLAFADSEPDEIDDRKRNYPLRGVIKELEIITSLLTDLDVEDARRRETDINESFHSDEEHLDNYYKHQFQERSQRKRLYLEERQVYLMEQVHIVYPEMAKWVENKIAKYKLEAVAKHKAQDNLRQESSDNDNTTSGSHTPQLSAGIQAKLDSIYSELEKDPKGNPDTSLGSDTSSDNVPQAEMIATHEREYETSEVYKPIGSSREQGFGESKDETGRGGIVENTPQEEYKTVQEDEQPNDSGLNDDCDCPHCKPEDSSSAQPPPPRDGRIKNPPWTSEHNNREMEFEDANVDTDTFQCAICFSDVDRRYQQGKVAPGCQHAESSFCLECIESMIDSAVRYDMWEHLKCPELDCQAALDSSAIKKYASETSYAKWEKLQLMKAFAGKDLNLHKNTDPGSPNKVEQALSCSSDGSPHSDFLEEGEEDRESEDNEDDEHLVWHSGEEQEDNEEPDYEGLSFNSEEPEDDTSHKVHKRNQPISAPDPQRGRTGSINHVGRHTNDWLFGGFHLTSKIGAPSGGAEGTGEAAKQALKTIQEPQDKDYPSRFKAPGPEERHKATTRSLAPLRGTDKHQEYRPGGIALDGRDTERGSNIDLEPASPLQTGNESWPSGHLEPKPASFLFSRRELSNPDFELFENLFLYAAGAESVDFILPIAQEAIYHRNVKRIYLIWTAKQLTEPIRARAAKLEDIIPSLTKVSLHETGHVMASSTLLQRWTINDTISTVLNRGRPKLEDLCSDFLGGAGSSESCMIISRGKGSISLRIFAEIGAGKHHGRGIRVSMYSPEGDYFGPLKTPERLGKVALRCPVYDCEKQYTQRENLSRHLRDYHGIERFSRDGKFVCPDCGEADTALGMALHLQSEHGYRFPPRSANPGVNWYPPWERAPNPQGAVPSLFDGHGTE
ncbi:hypothetical protein TWF481_004835 [Arthrobotrys musiformis]|uniref:C2H2-type domain-containing protein n=1 Tax=Arthrobotrys musiformis TaxID=47236 RepID=A0AAV9WMU9_9PEZI